jgi:hypothetical protein
LVYELSSCFLRLQPLHLVLSMRDVAKEDQKNRTHLSAHLTRERTRTGLLQSGFLILS